MIEDFLEQLESMSEAEREQLLLSVPDLTKQEEQYFRQTGRWSSRIIARYLGLAPGQERTVVNIMRKRIQAHG